jgi:heme/copper-type cytochrome/quinol oxidase subunit 2
MINRVVALVYNWTMGVVMIGVFALVCIILVGVLVNFIASGKNKKDRQDT